MLEMHKGRKTLVVLGCLTQYFLSKKTPSRIDLINAILTCFQFDQGTCDFNGGIATGLGDRDGIYQRVKEISGNKQDRKRQWTNRVARKRFFIFAFCFIVHRRDFSFLGRRCR